MLSLQQRYIAIFAAQHCGRRPWAWSGGMGGTLGRAWGRPAGGYNLYAGPPGAIDYATPIGASSPTGVPGSIATYPGYAFPPNAELQVALRAIGKGGVEEQNTVLVQTIMTDSGGIPLPALPNAPIKLTATPMSGGRFAMRWLYDQNGEQTPVALFNVYHDNGTGVMDYDTPIGTTASWGHVTSAYPNGTRVTFAVRAIGQLGVEEANTNTVTAEADAEGPLDLQAPTISDGNEP